MDSVGAMKARFLCAVAVALCLALPSIAQESTGASSTSTDDEVP
jgi:hypothetical protein